MAGPASNFILNIVELQNTITSASGLSPITSLSNTVSRLQEMVIYDEKRIAVNTISQYNTSPIQVQDSLNLAAGASITQEGTVIAGTGASGGSVSSMGSVGLGPNQIQFTSTTTAGAAAITFQVGAGPTTPLVVTADGITRLPVAGTPGVGKYLTCMDGAGTAEWQVPAMPSDIRLKENVRRLEGTGHILSNIQGVRFKWKDGGGGNGGGEDVGLIAQDVQAVLPEAVTGNDYLFVQYNKLIPVLVEEIRELQRRVESLEAAASRSKPA